ncbi:TOBE domain-containing protein [Alkalilimnicola ehrlichii]|uniref:TOBE domain-containing protein n=1 Tax=Alkalilimnicola ehrlichii TaxID=351052 RepID=UPI0015F29085|nr:TOBE domain-containing protein [Alkalilimnicola ehrlichii]
MDAEGPIKGSISQRVFQGEYYAVRVQLENGPQLKMQVSDCPPVNTPVRVSMNAEALCAWSSDGSPIDIKLKPQPFAIPA